MFIYILGFPGSTVVKNPSANAGDARDVASVPGSGRFSGVENVYSSILAWKISRAEKPGGGGGVYSSQASKR